MSYLYTVVFEVVNTFTVCMVVGMWSVSERLGRWCPRIGVHRGWHCSWMRTSPSLPQFFGHGKNPTWWWLRFKEPPSMCSFQCFPFAVQTWVLRVQPCPDPKITPAVHRPVLHGDIYELAESLSFAAQLTRLDSRGKKPGKVREDEVMYYSGLQNHRPLFTCIYLFGPSTLSTK